MISSVTRNKNTFFVGRGQAILSQVVVQDVIMSYVNCSFGSFPSFSVKPSQNVFLSTVNHFKNYNILVYLALPVRHVPKQDD